MEDYHYMTFVNGTLNRMKLTYLSSMFSLFCTSTFTSKFLIPLLNIHTRETYYTSLTNILKLMPHIIPLLTLTLVSLSMVGRTPPQRCSTMAFEMFANYLRDSSGERNSTSVNAFTSKSN
jgi:hypothetical protein